MQLVGSFHNSRQGRSHWFFCEDLQLAGRMSIRLAALIAAGLTCSGLSARHVRPVSRNTSDAGKLVWVLY